MCVGVGFEISSTLVAAKWLRYANPVLTTMLDKRNLQAICLSPWNESSHNLYSHSVKSFLHIKETSYQINEVLLDSLPTYYNIHT